MLIRAQFTGFEFRRLIRFRAASVMRPCPQLYFESSKIFVTQISFLDVTGIFTGPPKIVTYPNAGSPERSFQGNQIGLTLRFHVTASQLNANNDPVAFADKEGDVTIAVDLRVENGNDQLAIEVLKTDFDAILSMVGVGNQVMSNLLAADMFDLGLLKQIGDATKALGNFASIRHIDTGYNPENDRVEIRIEMSTGVVSPDMATAWAQFYTNAFDEITGGAPWGLFFDQRIGATLMKRSITAEIDASSEFRREGDVSVYWNAAAPGYHASVEGEVVDACQCLWGEIDLDVRAWLDLNFSLNAGKLRSDLWFDHKITDVAEAACCSITTSFLFPIFGVVMIFNGQLKWYEFLGGWLLSPFPLVSMIVSIARVSQIEPPPLQICIPDPSNDKHFTCEFDLPPMKELAGCGDAQLNLISDRLFGRPDGLVLTGRLDIPPIADPQIGIDQVTPMEYAKPVFYCSGGEGSGDNFSSEFRVFRSSGNYDFHVCQVHVLGPFKYAAKVEVSEKKCPYGAWVKVSLGFLQYDYSPIKLIVVTTSGAVHVVLAAPAVRISEEERKAAIQAAIFKRINDCYAKSKRWDVRWLIDPKPFIDIMQHRQIWAISGLASANSKWVAVIDEADNRIVSIDTASGRAMKFSFAYSGRLLAIEQESGDEQDLQSADFAVGQTLMGVERTLEFRTPVIAVDPVRMSPVRVVLVYEKELLHIFRVEGGSLLEQGMINIARFDWIGRQRSLLYAGDGDRLLILDLESSILRWRDLDAPTAKRLEGGCGCSVNKTQQSNGSLMVPPVPANLNFLVRRGHYTKQELVIQGDHWFEQREDLLVRSQLHRPLCNAGRVNFLCGASGLSRISSEVYVAFNESRTELEVLRTLKRLQL